MPWSDDALCPLYLCGHDKNRLRRFLRGLVHTAPEGSIGTSGVPIKGPSDKILAKCFEIRSTVCWYQYANNPYTRTRIRIRVHGSVYANGWVQKQSTRGSQT
jgi:hypothetical protein